VARLTPPEKIGIFGGTFDPPHIGHLILASEAAIQLSLTAVLWVLTRNPPHKGNRQITPVEIRLELLQAAISGDNRFRISRVEIDRPPPYFAVDTVRILQTQHPEAALIYLMGGDSLHDLPTWHHPGEFIRRCSAIGIMRRPGEPVDLPALEAKLPGIQEKIQWVEAPLIDISSSLVRRKVHQGFPICYYIPDAVAALVEKYHLYREGDESIFR
jgi:nicotinate-nucleotide adenylyltransferase